MKLLRSRTVVISFLALMTIIAGVTTLFAQRALTGLPPSSAPRTEWVDVFGQSIADQILQEARKRKTQGPVEVTLKFTVTPFGPPVEKPTWTPEDIKNLDVCAQICASLTCYVQCKMPAIHLPPVAQGTNKCDSIRAEFAKELRTNGCFPVAKK